MIKLIALDRDGVINQDSPSYIKSPDEWEAIPGSLEAIAKLNQSGYKVIVVTNQSGIARGYYDLETLDAIHKKMLDQVTKAGGHIEQIFFCPHGPQDNCDCRKPKPGMLLQAAKKFKISPQEILMIGDSIRDIEAAKNCGATALFIASKEKPKDLQTAIDMEMPVYNNLPGAIESICKK